MVQTKRNKRRTHASMENRLIFEHSNQTLRKRHVPRNRRGWFHQFLKNLEHGINISKTHMKLKLGYFHFSQRSPYPPHTIPLYLPPATHLLPAPPPTSHHHVNDGPLWNRVSSWQLVLGKNRRLNVGILLC